MRNSSTIKSKIFYQDFIVQISKREDSNIQHRTIKNILLLEFSKSIRNCKHAAKNFLRRLNFRSIRNSNAIKFMYEFPRSIANSNNSNAMSNVQSRILKRNNETHRGRLALWKTGRLLIHFSSGKNNNRQPDIRDAYVKLSPRNMHMREQTSGQTGNARPIVTAGIVGQRRSELRAARYEFNQLAKVRWKV